MVALPLTRRKFTAEEYLTIERQAEYRSEFLDGEIYAMAGASPRHVTIADNITGEVHPQLKGTPCQGMSHDMKVRSGAGGLYSYPDYLIVSGEQRYYDNEQDVLLNPVVVVEVLSPSAAQYDQTTKFDRYKQLESLREYLLVSQDEPRIEHFTLNQEGTWSQRIISGLDATFSLSSVPITLSLADIYDRIVFPQERTG